MYEKRLELTLNDWVWLFQHLAGPSHRLWLTSSLFSWLAGTESVMELQPRASLLHRTNERQCSWVPVWLTDFIGSYPVEEPWGVWWSVILDPELHSGRIRNRRPLRASPTPWMTAAPVMNKTRRKERNGWKQGELTETAVTTERPSTDYWPLWANQDVNLPTGKWPSHRSLNMTTLLQVQVDSTVAPWGGKKWGIHYHWPHNMVPEGLKRNDVT